MEYKVVEPSVLPSNRLQNVMRVGIMTSFTIPDFAQESEDPAKDNL
jgi:hypothetical protein